ncbi:MAG: hypothetical protein KDK45_24860, partial [Leptospiraceae bacterium]|nr:hypothetical protein [Leptospiraceae bacterium]
KNEIHKIINILSTLVEPILLNREKRKRKLSITEESDFSAYLSANEIYASLEEDRWTEEFHEKLENIAHYLRISQLEWILKQNPYRSSSTLARHLLNVYNLKQRIHLAREQFGGLAYLPQEIYINFFLSDLSEILSLQDLRPENKRRGFIRKGYIGPSEAAILLQAILSSPFEGRNVQLNLKYLFELISRKEEKFLQFTLIELSDESVRVLTQLLYRLFNFRQDILKEKLDFREIFERGLGLQIPIKKEIENTISKSYYQQLSKLATKILKNREEYDLIKKYIQIYKYSEYPITISPEAANLEKEAIDSIAEADTYAAKLSFNHRSEEKESAAIKLYEKSFKTCTKLLDLNPRAFQLAWFKKFWHRNHEALVILTVVRNYQKNIDSVRNWLHVQSGKSSFHNEQVLLETIIDVLYKKNKDKETLKNDPLVRLLIDPAPGKYDFSIVSCMGIITYGSEGTEL